MYGIKMTQEVYRQIVDTIGRHEPECGGVLGAKQEGVITEYYFDTTGRSSPNGYAPDVNAINEMLIKDWMPRGILMVGIVHSHSNGNSVPSCGDINYGIRILQALDTVDRFYLPIMAVNDGEIQMNGYVIMYDKAYGFVCRRDECEIV